MTAPHNTEVQRTIHHVASELAALEFINQDVAREISHVHGALLPSRNWRCNKTGFSGSTG